MTMIVRIYLLRHFFRQTKTNDEQQTNKTQIQKLTKYEIIHCFPRVDFDCSVEKKGRC